jgi:hypothetical protein
MALRVVTDVNEELGRLLRHADPIEQVARGCALLHEDRIPVARAAVGIADCVGASIGDSGEQRLRRERAIDTAPR